MASFTWDVQPYAAVSELVNAYTQVLMTTTIYRARERAKEAQEWMQVNAPWQDRTLRQRRRAEENGLVVPSRHARAALSVVVQVDKEAERSYAQMKSEAKRSDRELLRMVNRVRQKANVGRSPSRKLSAWTSVPKKFSAVTGLAQKIRVIRGPIVELKFSHGEDIWYGVWLEIAHSGRYGIISKAVGHWGAILQNDVKQIANLKQFNITFGETQTEEESFARYAASQGEGYEPWTPAKQETQRLGKLEARREARRTAAAEKARKEAEIEARRIKHLSTSSGEKPGGAIQFSSTGGIKRVVAKTSTIKRARR